MIRLKWAKFRWWSSCSTMRSLDYLHNLPLINRDDSTDHYLKKGGKSTRMTSNDHVLYIELIIYDKFLRWFIHWPDLKYLLMLCVTYLLPVVYYTLPLVVLNSTLSLPQWSVPLKRPHGEPWCSTGCSLLYISPVRVQGLYYRLIFFLFFFG